MLKHTPCGMHGAFIAVLQRTSGPSAPIPNIEYAARHGCAAYSPTVRPGAMSSANCLPSQYLCPLSMQHTTCGVQDATEMQQVQQACSPHPAVPLSITEHGAVQPDRLAPTCTKERVRMRTRMHGWMQLRIQ